MSDITVVGRGHNLIILIHWSLMYNKSISSDSFIHLSLNY